MRKNIIWSLVAVGLAAVFYYFGSRRTFLEVQSALEDQVEEMSEEIKILKEKNKQLTEELTSRGIFSYPQANVIANPNDSVATVVITLNGAEELKGLEVARSLVYGYSKLSEEALAKSLDQKKQTTHYGTLKTHNPAAFDVSMKKKEAAVNLHFESGRKEWNQYLRVAKSPDGEIKSFWIIVNKNSEVIDKHIDEGFPLDREGRIVLSEDRKIKYSDIEMNSIFKL